MSFPKEVNTLKRIFFLLLVSLTIMAGTAFYYILNDAQRDRLSELTSTAKVLRNYYESSFYQWELTLLSVGNRLMEIEDPVERLNYANKALSVYKNKLLAFGLSDTSGQVLTFSGRLLNDSLPNLRKSEKSRRSFDQALTKSVVSLGESYYFENLEDWVLPIRVPIKNDRGEIIAVNTSAINYNSLIADLDIFELNASYRVHLINNDFNTIQLLYPLARERYGAFFGSDSLQYGRLEISEVYNGMDILRGVDPIFGKESIIASTYMYPVNHQLLISTPSSTLYGLVFQRFMPVFIVYLILLIPSFFLVSFLKKNLKASLLKVRTEQANLKSIFESTSSIVGLFDQDKRLIEFNSAFNEYSKMTDGLTLERNIDLLAKIKHRESAEAFSRFMDHALNGTKFQKVFNYPGPKGELTFRFTYNPVYDDGHVVGFAFFAEDISEIRKYQRQLEDYSKELEQKVLKRTDELASKNLELKEGYEKLKATQQQLIQAEKMASLGILSAGIGHEINNPLNFIKHGAIALKEKLKREEHNPAYDQFFHVIEEGVRRASAIVAGLSHFSRTGEAMDETCDLHQILDNSLALLSSPLKAKEIEVIKSYEANPGITIGNEGKLHQVVTNIITNAEQAIHMTGKITLATRNENGLVVVEIADTGIGMTRATMKKITDPFFTTKNPGEGTGLGLFISQMIMDEHQAKMEVTSEKNKGTTFALRFKQPSSGAKGY